MDPNTSHGPFVLAEASEETPFFVGPLATVDEYEDGLYFPCVFMAVTSGTMLIHTHDEWARLKVVLSPATLYSPMADDWYETVTTDESDGTARLADGFATLRLEGCKTRVEFRDCTGRLFVSDFSDELPTVISPPLEEARYTVFWQSGRMGEVMSTIEISDGCTFADGALDTEAAHFVYFTTALEPWRVENKHS